jgi:hypothetical protein
MVDSINLSAFIWYYRHSLRCGLGGRLSFKGFMTQNGRVLAPSRI